MKVLDGLNINSSFKGLVQPADDFYNNTDSFYWAEHPEEFDDGYKEVKNGMTQNKDAKFKFLF